MTRSDHTHNILASRMWVAQCMARALLAMDFNTAHLTAEGRRAVVSAQSAILKAIEAATDMSVTDDLLEIEEVLEAAQRS